MNKRNCLLVMLLTFVMLFCGCSIKSPDIYEIGTFKIVSLSAVCKQCSVTSVEHINETDEVRKNIFNYTVKYSYNKITPENISEYFKRLEKDGYYSFSDNSVQSKEDSNGNFIELKIEENNVFISLGNIK